MRAVIASHRFVIRTLEPGDVTPAYAHWFRESSVKEYISWRADDKADVENALKDFVHQKFEAADALLLGIWVKSGGHIGNVKFEPISIPQQSAWVGILLGEAEWRGRGVFGEVFTAASTWLRSTFHIREYNLGVSRRNVRAVRAYEKVGFRLAANQTGDMTLSRGTVMHLDLE